MADILTLRHKITTRQEQCNISAELFYFYAIEQI